MVEKKTKGAMLQATVRSTGHKMTYVAKKLKISRTCLYKKIKANTISDRLLCEAGKIIGYDFAKDFPLLKYSASYANIKEGYKDIVEEKQIQEIQRKYCFLLEDYNKLLKFLVRFVSHNELEGLKKELETLVHRTHNHN